MVPQRCQVAVRLLAREHGQRFPVDPPVVSGGHLHGDPRFTGSDAQDRDHGRRRPDHVRPTGRHVLGRDHEDHRHGARRRWVVCPDRRPTRRLLCPGGLGVERDQTRTGRHADSPHVRLHGAVRVLLQHRRRPGDHGDDDLRPAATGADGEPRHPARTRGCGGGQPGLRRHRTPGPHRRAVAVGQAVDHGRPQPDPDAGYRHGGYRRHHGRLGSRPPGLPGRAEPRRGSRHLVRSGPVDRGRRPRPSVPARGGRRGQPADPNPRGHGQPP